MKVGRTTKYNASMCVNIIDYFTVDYSQEEELIEETIGIDENKFGKKKRQQKKITRKKTASQLPTFGGWCSSIGIVRQTMFNWMERHPEFLEAYTLCKQIQEDMLIQNALLGKYQAGFALFLAKNITNMRDDPEKEQENVELEL